MKNPQSQTHRVASELQAPVKFAITGTPLENGLTDLWALFHIVAPGLLSTWTRFGDDYVKPLASPEAPRRGPAGTHRAAAPTDPAAHAPPHQGSRRGRPAAEARTSRPGHARPRAPGAVRAHPEPRAPEGPRPDRRPVEEPDDRVPVADAAADARAVAGAGVDAGERLGRFRTSDPLRQARPAARRTRAARRGGPSRPGVQPVHLVPADGVRRPRRPRHRLRVPRRIHSQAPGGHRALPAGHGPGVPHLVEGRRVRPP